MDVSEIQGKVLYPKLGANDKNLSNDSESRCQAVITRAEGMGNLEENKMG